MNRNIQTTLDAARHFRLGFAAAGLGMRSVPPFEMRVTRALACFGGRSVRRCQAKSVAQHSAKLRTIRPQPGKGGGVKTGATPVLLPQRKLVRSRENVTMPARCSPAEAINQTTTLKPSTSGIKHHPEVIMNDSDLRATVLRRFYERRRTKSFRWVEADVPEGIAPRDFYLICNVLAEHKLIEWDPFDPNQTEVFGGFGRITTLGIDVLEGSACSPISIGITQEFSGTTGQPGSQAITSPSMTIGDLVKAIETSNAPDSEKDKARLLLGDFLRNWLVIEIPETPPPDTRPRA